MARLHYFAYGSNMHLERLRLRVPSRRVLGVARLDGHRLEFCKRGRDGSAKCSILDTGVSADVVHGVLFEIAAAERVDLDAAEGLGAGYDLREVRVVRGGEACTAFTYGAGREYVEAGLSPFDWYKALVLTGARQHGLPDRYVRTIEAVAAIPDPDASRAAAHWAIVAAGEE